MVDTLVVQIITAVSLGVGALVGINQLRVSWNSKQEKSEQRIKDLITESDKKILDHFEKNIEVMDTRITKDEEDIEDVEDDMKSMVKQFTVMCEKLSKHGYIIDNVVPEFKQLKKEFYRFKNAVDTNTKVGFTGIHSTNDNIDDPEKER